MSIDEMSLQDKMQMLASMNEKVNQWSPIGSAYDGPSKTYTDTWNTDIPFNRFFSERNKVKYEILNKFRGIYNGVELFEDSLTVNVVVNDTCKATISFKCH